jgi:alpha-L-arabinofuranosidase
LTLAVVNRDPERDHTATVDLGDAAATGGIAVAEVNGSDVGAVNSFESPRAVDVRETWVAVEGRRFPYRFPAHSLTVLRFKVGTLSASPCA